MTHPEGTKVIPTYIDPRVSEIASADYYTEVLIAMEGVVHTEDEVIEGLVALYDGNPKVKLWGQLTGQAEDTQRFTGTETGDTTRLPASWVTPIDDIDPDADVIEMDTPILGAVKGVEA